MTETGKGPGVGAERLSALDASFLAVEGPSTPMHVGWVATFDAPEDEPRPGFEALYEHIAGRLSHARRYRQQLASIPFGLHQPVWVDDPAFDLPRHLRHAPGDELEAIVDTILSTPLARDRPLWEIHIADELADGRVALVGKMHHCMVDGVAVVELGNLLLDREPGGMARVERRRRRLAGGARAGAPASVWPARWPTAPPTALPSRSRRCGSRPRRARLRGLPAAAGRGARTLGHTLLPPAPGSPLNRPGSARRRHARVSRPLDEIRSLRRRFGVTPNDVVLAVCAGALRRFAERRGEPPQRLKAMVPADVRSSADTAGSGNRIAFLFIALPCDEPDPVERLLEINRATSQRRADGDGGRRRRGVPGALALRPARCSRRLSQAFGHPRLFNLTISSVPGPAVPRYLRGCRLHEVHSAVPLPGRHALSIGVVTVAQRACFGIYADAETLPDAESARRRRSTRRSTSCWMREDDARCSARSSAWRSSTAARPRCARSTPSASSTSSATSRSA